jgi:hypothetical protein
MTYQEEIEGMRKDEEWAEPESGMLDLENVGYNTALTDVLPIIERAVAEAEKRGIQIGCEQADKLHKRK